MISLKGHTQRVLYQALSPCGKFIVTGAGDETLRFWDLGYQQETREGWGFNSKIKAPGLFGMGGKMKTIKGKNKKQSGLQIPVLR